VPANPTTEESATKNYLLPLCGLFFLVLFQGFLVTYAKKTNVFHERYDLRDSLLYNTDAPAKGKPLITSSFSMAEGTKNVEISFIHQWRTVG
jgi:hypothetical protein